MARKSESPELKQAEAHFDEFDKQVKDLTLDRMNQAPKIESQPQAEFSQKEIEKKPDHYLKPKRTVGTREKFNERFRDAWNFDKEYVQFQAQNNEIIGENIEMWTKPYAGVPAEEWCIPVNKAVWAPRYVAEQIKKASYHRLSTVDTVTGQEGPGKFYGQMVVDNTINRLDAFPVNGSRRSVFMGT